MNLLINVSDNVGFNSKKLCFFLKVVLTEVNLEYGYYDNGPEYNFVEDKNFHYSDSVHGWEGGILADRNGHYE